MFPSAHVSLLLTNTLHSIRHNEYTQVGLGVAVQQALSLGMDRAWQRIQRLAGLLRARLASLPGVTVHDTGVQLCGIVTFTKQGVPPASMQSKLASMGINVSVSAVTSNRTLFEQVGLHAVVRASVHVYNVEEEVDTLVGAVAGM